MKYLLLFSALLLAGCQKPSIYLYSKHISEQETQRLSKKFEQAGYDVQVNHFPFPPGTSDTSILFSPLLKDRSNVDEVTEILNKQGLPVNSVSSLVEGSHFVTKNAMAVFAVPDQSVFAASVQSGQVFTTQNCDAKFEVLVTSDRTAQVKQQDKTVNVTWQLLANQEIFQLTSSKGINYNYDIYKSESETPVGMVDEITLKPILWNTWFGDCEFYYGLARTAP